jgi:hypothetical protein
MEPAAVVALVLFFLGLAIAAHHWHIHRKDDPETSHNKKDSCACACYFQLNAISHCETVVVACLSNSITIFASTANPEMQSESVKVACRATAVVLIMLSLVTISTLIIALKFDIKHLCNHETWVLCLWTNSATVAVVNIILVGS